jgi:hypothetical protein
MQAVKKKRKETAKVIQPKTNQLFDTQQEEANDLEEETGTMAKNVEAEKDEDVDDIPEEERIVYTATRKGNLVIYPKSTDSGVVQEDDDFAPLAPELQTSSFGVRFVNDQRFALNNWEIRSQTEETAEEYQRLGHIDQLIHGKPCIHFTDIYSPITNINSLLTDIY